LEDPGIDGRIILKWIFETLDGGINLIGRAQDKDRWRAFVKAGMNFGSIKCGEFLEQLRTCWLLSKDSAPWS
jgi:hypothetical protein